jgi:hypothetical protein
MTETLYGFPITIMEMDNSYIITWKKVTLVIHNKTKKTPKENELIIDIISNTGAKGEGITLLCHILKKLKDDSDSDKKPKKKTKAKKRTTKKKDKGITITGNWNHETIRSAH